MKKNLWVYLVLLVALGVTLAPLYWLLTISLKTVVEQFARPPVWFGFTVTLEHYYDIFSFGPSAPTCGTVCWWPPAPPCFRWCWA